MPLTTAEMSRSPPNGAWFAKWQSCGRASHGSGKGEIGAGRKSQVAIPETASALDRARGDHLHRNADLPRSSGDDHCFQPIDRVSVFPRVSMDVSFCSRRIVA
jgi:hypothetical protein